MTTEKPVLLVTGGSRGIGAAVASLAATRGYRVCVNYLHNRVAADDVVAAIMASGGEAFAVPGDVAIEADVLAMFAECDARFGRLDALVNNAGILEPQSRLEAMSAARIAAVLATNVLGSLLCAREAVKCMSHMSGGRGGAIVNLSSMSAKLGAPNEYVDYAASKGAIDTMTVGLAKEVAAEGIRVNAVRGGLIHTEIHVRGGMPDRVERLATTVPMGRGGEAIEVARAVLWLCSDEASYTTGSFIDVSGGRM